ncbi:MAG: c-type cytochrome, partial [Verrucomicrobiaceae bacterium]
MKRVLLEAAAALKAKPEATGELNAALRTLLASPNPAVSTAALPLVAAWAPENHAAARELIDPLVAELDNASTPETRRGQVASALIGAREIAPEVLPAITRLLKGPANSGFKRQIISALSATGDKAAGAVLVAAFAELTPVEQDAAFNGLLARPEWTGAFLDAVEKRELNPNTLGPANIFRLRTHPAKEIASRATTLLDSFRKVNPDKEALVVKLLPVVTGLGDRTKGREIFNSACAVCHKYNDLGNEVGPVLTGMGAHGASNLLVHIVDPNRAVDAGYEVWNVETNDGQFQSGMLAQENDTRLVLKMIGAQVEVPKDRIKSRVNTHRSLMPEGLEALGEEALRDLLAFLCEDAGQYRVLDLSKAFTADTRRGLYQSAEALNDTLKFARYGLQTAEGVPFNIV